MIYKPKDSSLRYSEVIDFDEFPKIAIYVESLVCPFSKEEAADATKHKRLKKLRSRKPSDKKLNECTCYLPEFGPTEPTQEEAIQIRTEKVAGGRQKGRTYGLGSLNELQCLEAGWAGIGSSRQAEAINGVQLAAMSQQIAQLTRAVAESIAQNEVTRKTVEELKRQMASMTCHLRHRSPSPDSSSEEEIKSDDEFVGATP
ncbi:uncharacterized protein LOC107865609 [Capsicum annuum]|uniref:uncharacterized protein LOC107865609 n=1 Tax=Capsicum annuum TaxID=4072 RepID=UPI001FB14552|nr:uncharacterized protein LOC107865609 [Capsicum annuum]